MMRVLRCSWKRRVAGWVVLGVIQRVLRKRIVALIDSLRFQITLKNLKTQSTQPMQTSRSFLKRVPLLRMASMLRVKNNVERMCRISRQVLMIKLLTYRLQLLSVMIMSMLGPMVVAQRMRKRHAAPRSGKRWWAASRWWRRQSHCRELAVSRRRSVVIRGILWSFCKVSSCSSSSRRVW